MNAPILSRLILVIVVILSVGSSAQATTRSSTNYAIVNESFDSAGGQSSSAAYTNLSDTGGVAGRASVASPSETNKAGFVGQVAYVTGLQLTTTFTASADGTDQSIGATQTLDDGTSQLAGGSGVTWTVTAGQLPTGLMLDGSTGEISGTPAGLGHYSFTITVNDGLGNSVMEAFTGNVIETFADWEDRYQITDAPGSTPHHDGVPTLFKYLYNIDPTRAMSEADREALPTVDFGIPSGETTPFLTLTYRQYGGATGVTIQVQTSADLKTWTPQIASALTATPPDLTVPLGNDAVTGDPIIEVGMRSNGTNKQFIRLNVTMP